jgi:hypothetical protein
MLDLSIISHEVQLLMLLHKFRPIAIVAATGLITSIVAIQPAQALTIGAGDQVNLGGSYSLGGNPLVDFSGGPAGKGTFNVSSGTGSLNAFGGRSGLVLDFTPTLANILNPSGFTKADFLQFYGENPSDGNAANDLFFSLTQYISYSYTEIVPNVTDLYTIVFQGKFGGTGVSGATDAIATFRSEIPDGTGTRLLANLLLPPNFRTPVGSAYTWSATIVAVPTPALLPGLVGLGLTAWRKRRSVSV